MGTQWQYGQYADAAISNSWGVASMQGPEAQLDAEEQACHQGLLSLATSVQHMLPSLAQPQQGSMASAHLQEKQLNDKMSQLRTGIRDLELLAEEQDNPDKAKAVEALLKQHRAEYERLRVAISDAKRSAQLEVERTFAEQRKALLSGAALPALLRAPGNESEAVQSAAAITDSLRRTRQVLAQQLEHVANNTAFVETGNTTLAGAHQELQSQNPVIQEGKKGMRTLKRQSQGDRWLIWAGLWVFLLVAAYVGLKRAPAPVRAPINAALNIASRSLGMASRSAYQGTNWAVQSAITAAARRKQAQADEDDEEDEYQRAARRKGFGPGADQDRIIQVPKAKPGHDAPMPGESAAADFITTEVLNDTAQQPAAQQQQQSGGSQHHQHERHERHPAGEQHARSGGPLHFASDRELRTWLEEHVQSWDTLKQELPRLARNGAEKAHVMGMFADILEMRQMMRDETQQQAQHGKSGKPDNQDAQHQHHHQQQQPSGTPHTPPGSTRLPEAPEDIITGQTSESDDEDVQLLADDDFMERVTAHSPLGVIAPEERASGAWRTVQPGKDEPPARQGRLATSAMGVKEVDVVQEEDASLHQQAEPAQQAGSTQQQQQQQQQEGAQPGTLQGTQHERAEHVSTQHAGAATIASAGQQEAGADADALTQNAAQTLNGNNAADGSSTSDAAGNAPGGAVGAVTGVAAAQAAAGGNTAAHQQDHDMSFNSKHAASKAESPTGTPAANNQNTTATGGAGQVADRTPEPAVEPSQHGAAAPVAQELQDVAVAALITETKSGSTGAPAPAESSHAQEPPTHRHTPPPVTQKSHIPARDKAPAGVAGRGSEGKAQEADASASESETTAAGEVEVDVESVPLSEVLDSFGFDEPVIELVADSTSMEEWRESLLAASNVTEAGSAQAADSILGTADADSSRVLDPSQSDADLQGGVDQGLTAAEAAATAAAASDEAVYALVVTRPGSSQADMKRCKELLAGGAGSDRVDDKQSAVDAARQTADSARPEGVDHAQQSVHEKVADGIQRTITGMQDKGTGHAQSKEGSDSAAAASPEAGNSSQLVGNATDKFTDGASNVTVSSTTEEEAMTVLGLNATHATIHIPVAAAVDAFGTTQLLVAEQLANGSSGNETVDASTSHVDETLTSSTLAGSSSFGRHSDAPVSDGSLEQGNVTTAGARAGVAGGDTEGVTVEGDKEAATAHVSESADAAAHVADAVNADVDASIQEELVQAPGANVTGGKAAASPTGSHIEVTEEAPSAGDDGMAQAQAAEPDQAAADAVTVSEAAQAGGELAADKPVAELVGKDASEAQTRSHSTDAQSHSTDDSASANADVQTGAHQDDAVTKQGSAQHSPTAGDEHNSTAAPSKDVLDSIVAELERGYDDDQDDDEEEDEDEQEGGLVGYEEEAEEAVA